MTESADISRLMKAHDSFFFRYANFLVVLILLILVLVACLIKIDNTVAVPLILDSNRADASYVRYRSRLASRLIDKISSSSIYKITYNDPDSNTFKNMKVELVKLDVLKSSEHQSYSAVLLYFNAAEFRRISVKQNASIHLQLYAGSETLFNKLSKSNKTNSLHENFPAYIN